MNEQYFDYPETDDLDLLGYDEDSDYLDEDIDYVGEDFDEGYDDEDLYEVAEAQRRSLTRPRGNRSGGRGARRGPRGRGGSPRHSRPSPRHRPSPYPPTSERPAKEKTVQKAFSKVARHVDDVDVENKMQSSLISRKLKHHQERINSTQQALSIEKAIEPLEKVLGISEDPLVKNLIKLIPLVFVKIEKNKDGYDFFKDPRLLAPLVLIVSHFLEKNKESTPGETTASK